MRRCLLGRLATGGRRRPLPLPLPTPLPLLSSSTVPAPPCPTARAALAPARPPQHRRPLSTQARAKAPSPARQRQLLVEALLPAFKDRDYGRVLALLHHPNPTTADSRGATAAATASEAVAALTQCSTLAPLSLALYKAASAALTGEGREGEALVLLARGYRQGQLSEAALRRGYDGILWALRLELGDDGARLLAVVDALRGGRVRPTDGGYIPLLEALGERAGAGEVIYRVLMERLGPDESLPVGRKAVVYGLGLKGLVEARPPMDGARLLALKDDMRRRGVPLVGQHLGLLATALTSEGLVEECLGLLGEEGGGEVSARVVNMALAGLLRYQQKQQQEGKAGAGEASWEGAVRLLALLGARGERPTSHGVTAALLVCGRAGQWPLALRLLDEALWWDKHAPSSSVPHACDSATLNGAFEVLPPLGDDDDDEEGANSSDSSSILRLFGPRLYRQGVEAGLSRGWRRKQLPQQQSQQQKKPPPPPPPPQPRTFVIDLHEHSLRMAFHGALPDALLTLQQQKVPREVHIVTGHGTGRGRYRGRAPHHKPAPDAEVGVLYPRVRRWAERGVGGSGNRGVFEVSLGCVGIRGDALRRALPALLAAVS